MTASDLTAQRRSRRLGLIAFGLILLLATLALPVFTVATTVRSDDEVTIAASETIDNDLIVASNSFVLDGDVTLDVIVFARDADLNGNIGGSVNVAAATVTIAGDVDGSVRVASGTATITGTVGGDLLVFGGTVTIEQDAVVRGNVTMHGGTLTTRGDIAGDVNGNLERLTIDGPIEGNVSVRTGDLNLESGAAVAGELSYVSGSDADITDGAAVGGTVDRRTIAPWGVDGSWRARFFSPLVRMVWMLIAGVAVIALAPRLASALDHNMRRPLPALVIGLIALVVIPLVALLLAISVVGIPLSLILLGLYLVALYLSQYVVGQRLGTLILPDRWNDGSRGYLLLSMTIGVLLLSLLRYLPIPFVGNAIDLVITIAGLGAAVLLLGQLRPRGYTPALPGN